jgi:hypothetical protein
MDSLTPIVQRALSRPLPNDVNVMLAEVLKHFRSVDFVLTYGSILREVSVHETLIDFYVVTTDVQDISPSWFGRLLGQLLPPNVYYFQAGEGLHMLRCKCSVVTFDSFLQGVSQQARNPYFWARFSQPCALVYSRDTVARLRAVEIVSQAIRTAFANALSITPDGAPLRKWAQLFRATYRTELRPEGVDRAQGIVDINAAYYQAISAALAGAEPQMQNWMLLRVEGKILTVFRLIKAAFTFRGGADYAAWKIARHSGEQIVVKDWQRKHPVIAGIVLLPQLILKRVIR